MEEEFSSKVAITYDELLEKIKESGIDYDLEKIEKAYNLANDAHKGQKRKSGLPYITHPLCVAYIMVELGMDTDSVCAALLHDVVEDTQITLEEVKKKFGEDVANVTDGVTKLGKVPFLTKEEAQAENIRKMLLAMSEDIRVIIVKLADRLHNMRTIEFMPEQKRRDKALETMEIFAPLAHRLGIKAIKDEMEDISLRCLDPVGYKEIEKALELESSNREKLLTVIKNQLEKRVLEVVPDAHVDGRVKSINGIYRKLFIQNRALDQIFDIYAVRVIVNTVNDCYNVLGVIHDMYTPISFRFKDYIANPKPNLYQSLHTTVLGKERIPFEVQIRTWEMHHIAEYGIAAHWKYKSKVLKSSRSDEKLSWVRQIIETQQENADKTELLKTFKNDFSSDDISVFTPTGEVITLPKGATPIDFAYHIHSAVGNKMKGAKVDGKIVPIDYKLKVGEVVEIIVSKSEDKGPNRSWIQLVKTSQAKNKIRQWFKKERREENILEGKAEVDKEFKRNGIVLGEEEMQPFLEKVAKGQRCDTVDDFYAAIGYGGIVLWKIIPKIKDLYSKIKRDDSELESKIKITKSENKKAKGGIIVDNLQDCLIKISKCCNPLPGDEIIGFITRGYGVSIHKRDCTNVPKDIENSENPERWVKVHWNDDVNEHFEATLKIEVNNKAGVLANITSQLYNMHLFINSLNTRKTDEGRAIVYATITVSDLQHLNTIIARLSKADGVVSVERT